MKSIPAALLIAAALATATPARAQVFGQFTGAAVTPLNGHVFGGYLNVSENVVGGLAQLRLSFYPGLDFGFLGGLSRLDPGESITTRTTLRLGTDLRWQIPGIDGGFPLDLALGASLGVETADDYKVVALGPSLVASRTLGNSPDGGGYIPYAGLSLLFSSRDTFGNSDTDISMPLRIGLDARPSPEFRLIAELQLYITDHYNDDIGFVTGVNLPF